MADCCLFISMGEMHNAEVSALDNSNVVEAARNSKLFIIARRAGRLANRLVLFAHFIAFAEEKGHRVFNFTFNSYANLFETTQRDVFCRYPALVQKSWVDSVPGLAHAIRSSRIFYHAIRFASEWQTRLPILGQGTVILREREKTENTPLHHPKVLDQIRDAHVVLVDGWRFCASEWVQRHAPKIRSYFRPVAACRESSRQAVDCLRQRSDVVIGVHIRQGDYRRWRGGKFFFTISQYARWMRELVEQFPGRQVSFLVCSDESRHANEFPRLNVEFGPGAPVTDLYALAQCDYILGPPSTFSHWASFYGNKPLFHVTDNHVRPDLDRFAPSRLNFREIYLALELPS